MYKNISAIILIATLYSCNAVLDEVPDNRTEIDNAEKIGELLTAAYPEAAYATFLEPMTDNADDKGPSSRNEDEYNTFGYFWEDLANSPTEEDNRINYWDEAYSAIAHANQALASIEELGGVSADPKLAPLKGEALLCRAYSHFMLVNMFAKHYDPATASSDLGVPFVDEVETVAIKEYSRATVQEVYDKIKADLEEGLPLITNDYIAPKYHFNIKAANAFASRFYLFTGEWEKVIKHSNIVLENNSVLFLRAWNQPAYQNLSYTELTYKYTAVEEPANLLLVSAYSLYGRRFASLRYQLSSNLRTRLFTDSNPKGIGWEYRVFGGNDLFLNIPKFNEYFKVTNQAASVGLPFTTFVLLSADEALLNRAEAFTMLNMKGEALKDINSFLSVKLDNYDSSTDELNESDINSYYMVDDPDRYTPFYTLTNDQLPFINAVLELKRREFHNEGLRWFDIKRFKMKVVHEDFFGNEFTLEKSDNRKALQIPEDAQAFGLKDNPR